jgi:glycosyltransferase involved in cell wall biosynthesis
MKFCMITTFYPPYNFGGDGIYIYRLVNELAQRGHFVDVVHCEDAYRLMQKRGVNGEYPNHSNIRIFRLKGAVRFLSPLMTYLTSVPFFKRKKINSLVENNGYDVIHYHNMSLIGLTALKHGKALKLYTMHEHWLVCPMHVLWKFNREVCSKKSCLLCSLIMKRPPQLWRYLGLRDRMLEHVDGFISPSRFTRDKHHELGLNFHIRHIPYFLPRIKENEEIFDGETILPNTRPYFLFVGRLERIKGLQNLIPVFKEHNEYDLLVAGDGEYGEFLRNLARDVPNIKFLGRQSHEKLRDLYKRAIAVIVPSICYEVFGIIIIESYAVKTPVIVNNLGALPEVIEDSAGGIVYSNNHELVAAMERLAEDKNLCNEMGNRGYKAYLKYWSEKNHIEQYLDYIEDLQKKRNSQKKDLR